MASTLGRLGEREQTGSVAAGSPARSRAWQRQPPKSMVRRSQVLQGSCIQDSPRNFSKVAECCQISCEASVSYVVEVQAGDDFCGVAGEGFALGRDQD